MQDYTIQKGDYLGKIAKDAKISLRDLLKINPQIKDPNKIMPGDKLKLPSSYAPPPKFDDEDEITQESYEDRIVEFFGHYIAAKVALPNSKKAKRTAATMASELSSEYQQGKMPDSEGKQFFSGFTILKQLSNSLGGEYGIQSPMERYLMNNEVRPIEVKGYKVSRSDYQFFADAWQRVSMSEYGYTGKEMSLTGKPMPSSGIFENYFKQNLKEEEIDPEQSFDQPSTEDLRNNPIAGYIMQRLSPFLQGLLDDIDELTSRVDGLETGNTQVANFKDLKENVDISTSDIEVDELADIVVDEINTVFNQLPDGSPLKNREVALAALQQIKNSLPAMIQGINVA
jgi:LysM repeat protein